MKTSCFGEKKGSTSGKEAWKGGESTKELNMNKARDAKFEKEKKKIPWGGFADVLGGRVEHSPKPSKKGKPRKKPLAYPRTASAEATQQVGHLTSRGVVSQEETDRRGGGGLRRLAKITSRLRSARR